MKLARVTFVVAGIVGLIPFGPLAYEIAAKGEALLPAINSMGPLFHVSVFQYVCWQLFFFVLAVDPVRFRPMMIPAYFVEVMAPFSPMWLLLYGYSNWIPIAVANLVLSILFLVAFWVTGQEPVERPA